MDAYETPQNRINAISFVVKIKYPLKVYGKIELPKINPPPPERRYTHMITHK